MQHAEPKFMFTSDIFPEGAALDLGLMLQVCRKCSRLETPESGTKSYFYGLVSGQEERDAESAEG